jgi:carbonic anhydrase/acetyltransferase-like protein (isoleucine patch superfamily)
MAIYQLGEETPRIDDSAYVAELASVIGKVVLGKNTSVWDFAALRGDNETITISDGANVQEGAVLHTDIGCPLVVGKQTTVGHQAMLHGCTVGDGCLIGIQAVVLNKAVIGDESLVGAGALVTEGKVFPPRSLILGSPAKWVRTLTDEDLFRVRAGAMVYVEKAKLFKTQLKKIG